MYNIHALKDVIFIKICILYIYIFILYIYIYIFILYIYTQFFQIFFHRFVGKILDGKFLYNAYHFL